MKLVYDDQDIEVLSDPKLGDDEEKRYKDGIRYNR